MTYQLPPPDYQRLSDLQSGIDSWYSAVSLKKAFAAGVAQEQAVLAALREEYRVLDMTLASVESENRELRVQLAAWRSELAAQQAVRQEQDGAVPEQLPIPWSDIQPSDIRFESYVAGTGGFAAFKMGIRVRHIPTGRMASSEDERSEHANQQVALARLRLLLSMASGEDAS